MDGGLLDRIRVASETIASALRQVDGPAFATTTPDPAVVDRLQVAVGSVDRAMAEASDKERAGVRVHPAYVEYKDRLGQLRDALSLWQNHLLAHRAELDRKAERVSAAHHWAEAYNRTR
jgi:hypothetical protein